MQTNPRNYTIISILLCINIAAISGIAYMLSLQSQSLTNLEERTNDLNQQKSHVENVLSNLDTQITLFKNRPILKSIAAETIPTPFPKSSATWKTYTSKDFQFSISYPEGDIVTDLRAKAVEKGYPLPPGRPLFQVIHSPTVQVELGATPTLKAQEHMLEIIVKEPPASSSPCSFSRFGTYTEITIDNIQGERRPDGSSCFFLEEKNILVEIKVSLGPISDHNIASKILDSIRFQ